MEAFPKTAAFLKGQAGYFEEVEGALTLAFDVYQETGLPDCPKTFLEALLDEDDARDMRQCSLDQMDFDEHDTYAAIMQFLKDAQAAAQVSEPTTHHAAQPRATPRNHSTPRPMQNPLAV